MNNYDQAQSNYDSQCPPDDPEPKTWYCCGGIMLLEDEKCPICGEEYE